MDQLDYWLLKSIDCVAEMRQLESAGKTHTLEYESWLVAKEMCDRLAGRTTPHTGPLE